MAEAKLEQALVPVEDVKFITLLDNEGEIWVAIRPIVKSLGLNSGSQWRKLKFLEQKGVALKATDTEVEGNKVKMIFINLYDLPVYLYSININKVRPELREKIKKFQVETTKAIREYWKNKIRKEKEEIEKLKEEYNRLIEELRRIPTYEEYKELKFKYELLTSMIDMILNDAEKVKPLLDIMLTRIEQFKNGIIIKSIENGKLVKKTVKVSP